MKLCYRDASCFYRKYNTVCLSYQVVDSIKDMIDIFMLDYRKITSVVFS